MTIDTANPQIQAAAIIAAVKMLTDKYHAKLKPATVADYARQILAALEAGNVHAAKEASA